MITGKLHTDLGKWYKIRPNYQQRINFNHFIKLPLAFQFGVIQEFADDKGIDLDVNIGIDLQTGIKDGWDYKAFDFLGCETSLSKAREKAIREFNIRYNGSMGS